MAKEHDYYQLSLKVIIKNDKDEILALGCPPDGSFTGFYDFPGGRVDKHEFASPLSEIIKREIKEEVGSIEYELNPKPVSVGRHLLESRHSGLPEDVHVLYLFFEATYKNGDVNISEEHTSYQWFDMKKNEPAKLFKSGNLEGINMYLSKHDEI